MDLNEVEEAKNKFGVLKNVLTERNAEITGMFVESEQQEKHSCDLFNPAVYEAMLGDNRLVKGPYKVMGVTYIKK